MDLNCKEKPFGFQWPEKLVQIHGSYVSCDVKQNDVLNFDTNLPKMEVSLMTAIVKI